jgi:hypothetical protein
MDKNNKPVSCGGNLDFFGALTIAFIVLRLCNVITWPLWLVLSPILIPLITAIVIIIVGSILDSKN